MYIIVWLEKGFSENLSKKSYDHSNSESGSDRDHHNFSESDSSDEFSNYGSPHEYSREYKDLEEQMQKIQKRMQKFRR